MRLHLIRLSSGLVALALMAGAPQAIATEPLPPSTAGAMAQAASPQAIADYRRRLGGYQAARAAFEEGAGPYWASITQKRGGRNAKRARPRQIKLDDHG